MGILQNFVVFEGPDGSGTTTQLNILGNLLHPADKSPDYLHVAEPAVLCVNDLPIYKTFEPTNGSIGKLIRSSLRKEIDLSPETIAYLFAADRSEHLYGKEGIIARCRRGELVVSDRYLLSSLVYQGITCGEELPARLNQGFPQPELLIFLDIESETAQKRMAGRDQKEIYEDLEFQAQVCLRYKALLPILAEQGVRVEIIDSSPPAIEVAAKVWALVKNLPIFKG